MKRLLVVVDNARAARAIQTALRQTAGFQVVGFLDGRRAIRAKLVALRPGLVLLDDMHSADNTLARLREVREVAPAAKPVLLTLRMDDDWLEQVFDAGADAVLSKSVHPVALGTLLRETARSNIVHRYRRPAAIDAACPLTAREVEILRLAAAGYTNGRIARELWIAEKTVKFHLSNTYRKLGVSNRTQASRYAYTNAIMAGERLVS